MRNVDVMPRHEAIHGQHGPGPALVTLAHEAGHADGTPDASLDHARTTEYWTERLIDHVADWTAGGRP